MKSIHKMKPWAIAKLKKISLQYGFYTQLSDIKQKYDELFSPSLLADNEPPKEFQVLFKEKLLKTKPSWTVISVMPGCKVKLRAAVKYNAGSSGDSRSLLLFRGIKKDGSQIDVKLGNVAYSSKMKAYFKYLPDTNKKQEVIHEFSVEKEIEKLKIGVAKFNGAKNDVVFLDSLVAIIDKPDQQASFVPPSAQAAEISILGWPEYPNNGKPFAMGVMDEFTTGCFEEELNLLQPRPDNWYALAEKYKPSMFFIESAWKGNRGSWQYRVAEYANKPGQEVAHMVHYARQKGIPTIFWNKEDPVHHQKFMCSAKLVDHIFTTDANMCASYRKRTSNDNVHALPFAAQPALHKPAPLDGRLRRSCFAGSWYGDRHAERGQSIRWLLQAANRHGLDIYDRNFGTGIFPFPDEYQTGIKGSLPYKLLCKEYSKYRVFLNVNSVTDSPTMFSRRVFELMACGTPVVSTYARGIEELFETDAVWLVRSETEAEEAIHTLLSDDVEWRRRSLAGIREVFSSHTYAHRVNEVFEKVGLNQRIPVDPDLLLVGRATSQHELHDLYRAAQNQHYRHFTLVIECTDGLPTGTPPANVELVGSGYLHSDALAAKAIDFVAMGWLSSLWHYGPGYLRDLVNAMSYQPAAAGWAKSIADDAFDFYQPAVLSGALWQCDTFLAQWMHTDLKKIIKQPALFSIDSNEFDQHAQHQLVEG